MKKILLFSLLAGHVLFAASQNFDKLAARQLISKHADQIGLSKTDISNAIISDAYYNETSGTRLVYLQQGYLNLPVYNRIRVLAFKDDKIVSHTGDFLPNLEKMIARKTAVPSISAAKAIKQAFKESKIESPASIPIVLAGPDSKMNFGILKGVNEDVIATLMWLPVQNETKVRLVWQVQVVPAQQADWWMLYIDAHTGKYLYKDNLTVHEGPQNNFIFPVSQETNLLQTEPVQFFKVIHNGAPHQTQSYFSPSLVGTVNYNVVPYPAESPIHPGGTPAIRTNPWANAPGNATSLGWHNDGANDYTITRGNNVWATEDRAGTNGSTIITPTGLPATSTTTPDPLNFNFTPNFSGALPVQATNQQFGITNLFYWNNIVHDITYQYGFTEPAGNFQANNQGRGGAGNDYVIAIAQSSVSTNNANFATPSDGGRGRMRMYLFDQIPTLTVNTPIAIGGRYRAIESNFSTANKLKNVGPVTAPVIYYEDGGNHEACSDPVNILTGKIVIINRGNCPFVDKVKRAQLAGAVAVIMVNNVPNELITMGGDDNTITIPAVSITQGDGAILIGQVFNNLNITLAGSFDGDLDAGVMSHEYTHGISNRLTGGPAASSCLSNVESGGEGWSDYVGLMLTTDWSTAQLTDGTKRRPVGTYVFGGFGLRNYDYSTDFNINRLTYDSMGNANIGVEVHNIGEIWCSALWEMTWGIIQQTGSINPNLYNASGTGGNSIALKLVIEGMKLQPCNPGFISARDGILKADTLLYNGANSCAIWSAFAKRGMGYGASQGSSNSGTDQTPSYALPPAPSITVQPAPVSACAGNSALFYVTTTGVGASYNWQVSTDGGNTWNSVNPAVNNDSLTLNNITVAMNNYQYRVVVSGGCGSGGSFNSNSATLSVSSATISVSTQPLDVSTCAGSSASFTVAATGSGITYNWQVSTDGGNTWNSLSPAVTSATLLLSNVTLAMNNYKYRAVITASSSCPGGSSINSSVATLTVTTGSVSITTQPASTAVCAGSNVNFTIMATGTNLTYNWQVSTDGGSTWNNLSPAVTTATLTLSNVTAGMNNNQYRVNVNGTGGCAGGINSNAVTLTINASTAITAQPTAAPVCTGGNVDLCVVASGNNLTYQWQLGTAGCSGSFADITGATNACYQITNATVGMNNLAYRVLVTGACAPVVTSNCVTLTVNSAPVLNTNPVNSIVCAGANTSFTAAATGTNLSYNWQVSTDGGSTWNNLSPAVTTATLTLNAVTVSMNNNRYRVQVTGDGTCTTPVVSTAASLTVNALPAITAQVTGAGVCAGTNVSFSCTATGSGLSYQWQSSAAGCAGPWTNITGATNASLAVNNVSLAMDGTAYRVIVSGTCAPAVTSSCGLLTVISAATISTQPTDVSVCAGSPATFTVSANGTGISYQWQMSTDAGATYTDIAGATASTYSITSATAALNNTKYRVKVTNCGPGVFSDAATLSVTDIPVVTITNVAVNNMPGIVSVLTATVTPTGNYIYTWYKNNEVVPNQMNSTLPLAASDGGMYKVNAAHAIVGCASTSGDLQVATLPDIVLIITPSPNGGVFNVIYNNPAAPTGKFELNIFDGKGSKVYHKLYDVTVPYQNMHVELKNVSHGIYGIELADLKGVRIATGKVLIVK